VNALAALQPFARGWRAVAPAGERCQVCAGAIAEDQHEHLVDLQRRSLLCACRSCATLFAPPGATAGAGSASAPGAGAAARYRVVPTRVLVDPAFRLKDAQWSALQIPVGLAFIFFNSSLARWVALYPSPAGAAESELTLEAMKELAAATPLLAEAQPDVEALLVYGRRGGDFDSYLAPIDACYRLVGRVRVHWQGFHGGDAAWREIEAFFEDLRARARPVAGAPP
jgi:hypothetical protein